MSLANKSELLCVTEQIHLHAKNLVEYLSRESISPPSLDVGARTKLWTTHTGPIEELRSAINGLTQQLDKLLQGPHGFLHEYVSTNWEFGALYTLLEYGVLETIPLHGVANIGELAEQAALPADKLLRICRLAACSGILKEVDDGVFAHTAVSEELVTDEGFKSFIAFQWGKSMYEWHAQHPEKGQRFAKAMESVSKALDPGNGMIMDWFRGRPNLCEDQGCLVVDVAGKTGSFAVDLADAFPNLHVQVQDPSATALSKGKEILREDLSERVTFHQRELFLTRSITEHTKSGHDGTAPLVFLVRSAMWCHDDDSCVKLLRSFIPVLESPGHPTLLVCDLVSPAWGTFEPHVERAFRRRDVTLMTMHNAKQRTSTEWMALLKEACPNFKVEYSEQYSSHSCRGLWQIQLAGE
ncbi:O-methyltransferase, family 2 [Metarhizium album ARSEF 1941]|uniref:O-methyltransferase, family 2 n=1 Tax=Metarhizium album (strain ARSEF 1941) TaxID=1081103 RepID=A0A0B2WMH8_METAS|nr:O-methyltransferase, family 2 [Metarhizium album ARSEF 1941]KHN94889.1 O-methyltransferase, family 2 [Metarhizium album ARSEF 1941]